MRSAAFYRKISRDQLGNKIFGKKWLYALLVILVYGAIISALTAPLSFINENIGPIVGSVLSILVSGPLTYGIIKCYFRALRNEDEHANLANLFDGFLEKFSKSFVTSLLQSLYTVLWSCLFLIPGLIKTYSYAATMYLVYEKDLDGNEAITESRRLMNGKKMDLFCLDLSFIGWYLVGLLCFGVGVLWVEAYHVMARTNFFDELINGSVVVDVKPVNE